MGEARSMGGMEPWTLADGERLNREHPPKLLHPVA
jgi:hypothetical protein